MQDLFLNNASSNSPIRTIEEDKFGRKNIVEAISSFIKIQSENNHECITMGIYASWGEGKSSVLNMIKSQLKDEKDIIIAEYNPWFFKDQESMLLDFFNIIPGKSIDTQFVKALKEYGNIVVMGAAGIAKISASLIGTSSLNDSIDNIQERATQAIKGLPDLKRSPAERKKELSTKIRKSGKHLVIFVDDIDRLDKDEVHTLLKLVRQVADFDNTIFVLSMDMTMVAKSIATKFENGEDNAGVSFIEKIVQYPIYLPKIQSKYFAAFLREKLSAIWDSLPNASAHKTEIDKAHEDIFNYVLPLLKSGRDVIRYISVLSFSLPLIYEEVNISDLCLLEALKVINPHSYYETRNNKSQVVNIIPQKMVMKMALDKEGKVKEEIEKNRKAFKNQLYAGISSNNLPFLDQLIDRLLHHYFNSHSNDPSREAHKRLTSPIYFDKYFIIDVPEGAMPDVEIAKLVGEIRDLKVEELKDVFDSYESKYGFEELKRALDQILWNFISYEYTSSHTSNICLALAMMESNNTDRYFSEMGTNRHNIICIYAYRYMANYVQDKDGRIEKENDYDMLLETMGNISTSVNTKAALFSIVAIANETHLSGDYLSAQNEIVVSSAKKYLTEFGEKDFFNLGQICLKTILSSWKSTNEDEYYDFMKKAISNPEFNAVQFLYTINYSGVAWSLLPAKEFHDKLSEEGNINSDIYQIHQVKEFVKRYEEEVMTETD